MKNLMLRIALTLGAIFALTAMAHAQPDMTFGAVTLEGKPGVTIPVTCGKDVNVNRGDASDVKAGPRFGYTVVVQVRNVGATNSANFNCQVMIDGAPAPVTPNPIHVVAGGMVMIKAKIYATAGIHNVDIRLDNPPAVPESDETNNRCNFTLTVL